MRTADDNLFYYRDLLNCLTPIISSLSISIKVILIKKVSKSALAILRNVDALSLGPSPKFKFNFKIQHFSTLFSRFMK